MTGYVGAIERETLKNTYFRRVLFTGKHTQLVVMCLQPGEEIGKEVHTGVDQSSASSRERRSPSSSTTSAGKRSFFAGCGSPTCC